MIIFLRNALVMEIKKSACWQCKMEKYTSDDGGYKRLFMKLLILGNHTCGNRVRMFFAMRGLPMRYRRRL